METYKTALESGFCGATHIVIGIRYGCAAFFEFTRSVDSSETKYEVLVEKRTAIKSMTKVNHLQAHGEQTWMAPAGWGGRT